MTNETQYELRLPTYTGPIEKLLELIEGQKLEITELNLAEVTGDFLSYLEKVEQFHPRILADFIVVASKLLLIKSRALLPNIELTAEEEKDIKDLEEQLKFYQSFKPAMNHLEKKWEENQFSVSRPLMAGRPIIFFPSANITIPNLREAINSLFEALDKITMEIKTIKSPLISLEEKIQEIINALQGSKAGIKFNHLKKDKRRSEIIVMFLALLHLIEKQLIRAKQKSKFSDIIITK